MCQEFKKTRFLTVPIATTLQSGIALGQGKCGAVRLRLNCCLRNAPDNFVTGSNNPTVPFFVYFGDSQSQENELLAYISNSSDDIVMQANFGWTPKIYCENLEQVFIRYSGQANSNSEWPEIAYVQVMIYSNE